MKTMKKAAALLLSVAMLLTMVVSVNAATAATLTLENSAEDIYVGDVFTVTMNISAAGITGLRNGALYITYPANIAPCNAEGVELTSWTSTMDASYVNHPDALAVEPPATHFIQNGSIADNKVGLEVLMNNSNVPAIPVTEGSVDVLAIRFLAKTAGENLTITLTEGKETGFIASEGDLTLSYTATPFTVQAMPEKPEITNATVGGTLRAGAKAEASYTWDNGNQSGSTEGGDASVINWTVDGEAVTKLETDERLELTLKDEWVGKKLAYTVRPTAARGTVDKPLNNTADADVVVAASDATMVKAASNYAESFTAEVEADFTDEITAKKAVNVTVTLDDTYPEAAIADTTVISWYVLPAVAEGEDDYTVETAKGASLEGITPVTGATATFDVANKDQWVVVVVAPKATIAGEEFTAAEVKLAAKISGEPPELAEGAEAAIAKLAAKKYFTSSTPDATTVKFVSKVAADIENVDPEYIGYTYAWYLTDAAQTADNFNAESATAITAEDALKTPGKVKLSKVENAETKFLNVVITATDDLDISSSVTVCFTNPIKKATGGSGTQGGASLVTGNNGTVVEPDEPAVEPEKDPADPAGEANDKGASVFTDVDKEVYAWGYDYLDKLAKAGVVKGMTETTYAPEEETTYAQFTALVVRVLGLTAEEAATEKVAADHWSFAEVSVADKLGLLADVAFDADKAITREDMAAIAHKALVAKAVELKAGEAVEYSDASAISEYAAAAIDAMSKAGILNGMGDGTFAPKGTTTRMQTAKVIGMISELIG